MKYIRLAGRVSTVLWKGDVIVLGAGLAGVTASVGSAASGMAMASDISGFHPIGKAQVLLRSMKEAGVGVFQGHMVFGVVKQGQRVKAPGFGR